MKKGKLDHCQCMIKKIISHYYYGKNHYNFKCVFWTSKNQTVGNNLRIIETIDITKKMTVNDTSTIV